MNWRKVAAGVMTTVLAASIVAGCATKKEAPKPAGEAAPAEKVTLEWWGWWSSATRMPTIEKIVKDWNEKNPNIQVKYTFVPFDQILTKYTASVAAGNPPDMVSADLALLPMRAQKKQAMDLSALGADAIKGDYFPGLWSAGVFNGKVYSLPWMGDSRFLYYNQDMFKDAGLTDADAPKTWDDLMKLADKLDKKDNGKLTRVGFHPMIGNFGYESWVLNAGGKFFDESDKPAVSNDVSVKTLDWIKKWNDRYGRTEWAAFSGAFGNGANHPFVLGKAAMVVETPTFLGEALKNNPNLHIGRVAVPTPDGKQHPFAAISSGFGIELPTGSKHAKQAFEFAKYWTGDAAKVWATEQNDFPANQKVAGTIQTAQFQEVVKQMANTSYVKTPMYAPSWRDATKVAVDDVMAGKKDSKTALDAAQKAIEQMVKENSSK